jgi:hypothetical protein
VHRGASGDPFLDPTGEPESGECGKADVSGSVEAVLNEIEHDFSRWDFCARRGHCEALYDKAARGYSWDISALTLIGGGGWPEYWPATAVQGVGADCERTVVYRGGCYKASVVNYLMWGKVNSLCHQEFPGDERYTRGFAYAAAVYWKVTHWRGVYAVGAGLFTLAGYSQTPYAPTLCSLPECHTDRAVRTVLGPPGRSPYHWKSIDHEAQVW